MKVRAFTVGIVAAVALACQNPPPAPSPSPGAWLLGSKPVDQHVAATFIGPEHCGLQGTTFLVIGWPLGTAENIADARWYLRNPTDFVKREYLLGEFDMNVTPPKDARYTRFHNSTFELWLAPADQDVAAYIKTGGHFERWPRAKRAFFCQ
jgi:hypothetical protein